MIHELIGIHNNTVDLQGRPDVPDEMRKMTLIEPGNVLRLDKRKEVEGVRWAPNAIITDSA